MPQHITNYAFECYPRALIPFRNTRRNLLRDLVLEIAVECGKTQGQPAQRLSDLGVWPDVALETICPVVVSGTAITLKDNLVWGRPPGAEEPFILFSLESPARIVFNAFDGNTSLKQAGDRAAFDQGWVQEQGFAYARGVFLALIAAGICVPANR